MNILMIMPDFPNTQGKGYQILAYERIKFLSKFYKITLVCLANKKDVPKRIDVFLKKTCSEIIFYKINIIEKTIFLVKGAFFHDLPIQLALFTSQSLINLIMIKDSIEDFTFFYCLTVRPFENIRNIKKPIYLDAIDSLTLNLESRARKKIYFAKILFQFEASRMRRYEFMVHKFCKKILLVSSIDSLYFGGNKTNIIPIAVSNSFLIENNIKKFKVPTIVFSGNLSYGPNIDSILWFSKNCFPLIKAYIPNVNFMIIGRNPGFLIKNIQGNGILLKENVKDMAKCLSKAHVSVALMVNGSGMQFKILEAMACGLPVLTNKFGLGDICAKSSSEMLLKEKPEDISNALLRILSSKTIAKKIGSNARKFVLKNHTWPVVNKKLFNVLNS
jgi:glycosyltransferase involved in cell wall biosynthesis